MGLTIKDIHIGIPQFHEFVNSVVKSVKDLLQDELLFGSDPPKIDLNMLRDVMMRDEVGFSFLNELVNQLEEGYRYMLHLVKSCQSDKRLLNRKGEWDRKRVLEYLYKKKQMLELLMLVVHLIGGQSTRDSEIGSIKFRNSALT